MAKTKTKSKSSFDFKQALLQRGERIGLISAAALTLLLVVISLFLPGSGLFSGSSSEKAAALNQPAEMVERALNDPNNVPTDADKPPADSKDKLISLSNDSINGAQFALGSSLIPAEAHTGGGRRNPKVLAIGEGRAAVARVQVRTVLFSKDNPPRVYVLRGEGESGRTPKDMGKGSSMGPAPGANMGKRFGLGGKGGKGGGKGSDSGSQGYPSGMFGGPGMPGSNPGPGAKGKAKKEPPRNLFELPKTSKDEQRQGKRAVPVKMEDFKDSDTPAVQVRPLRMAVIAASFPYAEQVKEFRTRLGHRTAEEVLIEGVKGKDDKAPVEFAFRFLGVEVQRRELDGDGKPLTDPEYTDKEGWYGVDVAAHYKPYVVLTGRDFEPDDQALAVISYPGLVMPRLKQFRLDDSAAGGTDDGMFPMPGSSEGPKPGDGVGKKGRDKEEKPAKKEAAEEDQYPPIEKQLKSVKETLAALEEKDPSEVAAPPSRFRAEDFDPFNPGRTAGAAKDKDRELMPMMKFPMGGMVPRMGDEAELKPKPIPEHCLVRLIDVTVQPGKTYEYRLRVRMANPNYKRTDVASPKYGADPELERGEWSKNPIIVRVEPELNYYAIDQEQVERQESKDPRSLKYSDRYSKALSGGEIKLDRQMFFQAHRWLERTTHRGNSVDLGEWGVAERFPVARGEYVGRQERVELPMWRYDLEDFIIATDSSTSKYNPGIAVHFGYDVRGPQPEAILVDFEHGTSTYNRVESRTEDKVTTKAIRDSSAGEALILTPDGRLLLRETALDSADPVRKERLKKVKQRAREIKNRGKDESEDKDKKDKKDKDKGGKKPFGD